MKKFSNAEEIPRNTLVNEEVVEIGNIQYTAITEDYGENPEPFKEGYYLIIGPEGYACVSHNAEAIIIHRGAGIAQNGAIITTFSLSEAEAHSGGRIDAYRQGRGIIHEGGEGRAYEDGEITVYHQGKGYVYSGGIARVYDGGYCEINKGSMPTEIHKGGYGIVNPGGHGLVFEKGSILVASGGFAEAFSGSRIEVQVGGEATINAGAEVVVN